MADIPPTSVVSAGSWTAVPSGTLAGAVDETVANDTDYMQSSAGATEDAAVLGFPAIVTPTLGSRLLALATDNFNRADGQLDIISPTLWARMSPRHDNPMRITSNVATVSSFGSDAGMRYIGVTWPRDQYSQGKITESGASAGNGSGPCLSVRMNPMTRTHYRVSFNHFATNNIQLRRFYNTTPTGSASVALLTFTQAWVDGDTWRIEARGPLVSLWLNNVFIRGWYDDVIIEGNAGISYSSSVTAATIDDWEGGTFNPSAVGLFTRHKTP